MARYRYTALKEDKFNREIRILEVLPPSSDAEKEVIRCTLTHRPLARRREDSRKAMLAESAHGQHDGAAPDPLDYEAVSWTWGQSNDFTSIQIWQADAWVTHPVRPNLLKALVHLRYANKARTLWIDAVCIDQENEKEKDLQVAMMADIYSTATNVCIWLGTHEHESELALRFIKDRARDLGAFESMTKDESAKEEWKALAALMNRPWFSRRWVRILHLTLHRCIATLVPIFLIRLPNIR